MGQHKKQLIRDKKNGNRHSGKAYTGPQPTFLIIDEMTGVDEPSKEQLDSWTNRIIHITSPYPKPDPAYEQLREQVLAETGVNLVIP